MRPVREFDILTYFVLGCASLQELYDSIQDYMDMWQMF